MLTVLVVDDDEVITAVAQMSLEQAGFDVRSANDGASALEELAARPPDAVVLDVTMPQIDGWTILSRLRQQPGFASLPVVMLTGHSHPEDRQRGMSLGASAFLPKPFSPVELVDTVRRVLGGQS